MPNEQLQQQLLEQLQGLDYPEAVNWWPLAIGWWLLLIVAVILSAVVIQSLRQSANNRQRNMYRKVAFTELHATFKYWQDDDNSAQYLQSTNGILRRIIRQLECNSEKANTAHTVNTKSGTTDTGEKWGNTLKRYAQQPLSEHALTALTESCYQADPKVDIAHLHREISSWIKTHKRGSDV